MIPYGHQSIDEEDIQAVVDVLRSDFLTQGPKVEEFEKKLADYCGAQYAVVVSNGTTALHAAYVAIGLKPGDEVITSPITFPATTNAALWQGAKPVFVDIEEGTGNINADLIEAKITAKTRAIAPINYTGRPVNLEKISALAKKYDLVVVEDACQALGASYHGKKIGSLSDLTVFSFHPVKTIATGEGGAILTNNKDYYDIMKKFVTHGITKHNFVNSSPGDWYFEMQMLGMNYRLTDIQAALGISQLKKITSFLEKRKALVARYTKELSSIPGLILPPDDSKAEQSAWHLYVIRLRDSSKRSEIFAKLRAAGVGVNVHHIPVHLHPYYRELGFGPGLCPLAESWYESIISLPLFPDLSFTDQDYVIKQLRELVV